MSIIISSGLVLSDVVSGGGIINANNPVIGWQTRITSGNVTATTAETGYPASNLANPSTELLWRGLVSSPAQDEYLTLALNYFFGQLDPFGYHLVNFFIHVGASYVLYVIALNVLRNYRGGKEGVWPAAPAAFALASLWCVHPLQTQSVTYVIQRAESLMSLFFLLTFFFSLKYFKPKAN